MTVATSNSERIGSWVRKAVRNLYALQSLLRSHWPFGLFLSMFMALVMLVPPANLPRDLFHWLVLVPFVPSLRRSNVSLLLHSPMLLILTASLLYVWLTTFWTPDLPVVLHWKSLKYVTIILLFLYVTSWLVHSFDRFRSRLFWWMGWAAVATAVASLVMAARGQSIQPDGRLLAWLWPEPNSAAAIFSVVLIGFVYHHVLPVRDGAVRRPLILTLLNLLATAIMLVFLALTGSRIASVGAVFGLLLVAWKGTKSRRIRLALIVGLAAVCLAAVGAMWHRWERGIVTDESSLYINLWQHYFDLGLERPWLGHGIMASEQIVHGEQILTNSHNKLIDAFYYGGVVAVVLMLALIVVASRAAWLAWRREADPVPAALLVCCVTYTYGIPAVLALFWKIDWWWIHCWLPLGLIAGAELRNSGPARRMFEFPRASVLGPAALQSPSPVI